MRRNLEGKSKYCLRWKLLKTGGESNASRSTVLRTFIRGMRGLFERGSKPPILQARGGQACRRVMSALAATSLRRGCLNRPSGSYPDGFIRSEFRAIVLQASQGVRWRGPGLRSRAFELSKESPRVANFYVAFGTIVGI